MIEAVEITPNDRFQVIAELSAPALACRRRIWSQTSSKRPGKIGRSGMAKPNTHNTWTPDSGTLLS
jgi:hypothetical protein